MSKFYPLQIFVFLFTLAVLAGPMPLFAGDTPKPIAPAPVSAPPAALVPEPEATDPVDTPEFRQKVAAVEAGLRAGEDLFLQARYDDALAAYEGVLSLDRYNTAARQGMEKVERAIIDYLAAANNHTRAKMLREVDAGWETQAATPSGLKNSLDASAADLNQQDIESRNRRDLLSRKMKTIIIDQLNIEGETLRDALSTILTKARASDRNAAEGEARGINVILDVGTEEDPVAQRIFNTAINLQLRQTPLVNVIEYLAQQAGLRMRVESFAVVLVPAENSDQFLFLRSYSVPPDFISSMPAEAGATGGNDPFAADSGGGLSLKKLSPKEFLEQSGITFPANAFVSFDTRASSLTMRNTPANHETLEMMIESARTNVTPLVMIETKVLEINEQDLNELGFDWLLGAFDLGSGAVGSGGTGAVNPADFPLSTQGLVGPAVPLGINPVTAGNRSGSGAITGNSLNKLLSEVNTGDFGSSAQRAPGVLSLGGALTEPNFQVVIRALAQKKGTDFLTAPSVVTRSGLPAKIEIVREFIYPTEYDPPEIPNEVGSGTGTFPVTPATPTAFETTLVGTTLDVEPVVSADAKVIEVNFETVHREFIGFVNYGSPITGSDLEGDQTILTENKILQPIFETRRIKTSSSVYSSQSLVVGGLISENRENVEDKVPLLGDVPMFGRFFKSKVDERVRKVLLIFLKVDTLDPSGKPFHQSTAIAGPEF